jgi:hypothetical protein
MVCFASARLDKALSLFIPSLAVCQPPAAPEFFLRNEMEFGRLSATAPP